MSAPDQLSLLPRRFRHDGCAEPVVGHSVATEADEMVCERHNEIEWGEALVKQPAHRALGLRLIARNA